MKLTLGEIYRKLDHNITVHAGESKDGHLKTLTFNPWDATYSITSGGKYVKQGVVDPIIMLHYYNKL